MMDIQRSAPAGGHPAEGESTNEMGHDKYTATGQKVTSKASLTIITASRPKRLTKQYRLQQGELVKANGGSMQAGRAQVVQVDGLTGLSAVLSGLETNQALCYGIPERESVDVVTREVWHKLGKPEDPIPRIKEAFFWPAGCAVMMLDYDPASGPVLDRAALLAAVHGAVPALAGVSALWFPSSSSHVTNSENGEDLTGLRGQRLYFIVKDGGDIERAGNDLQVYLWAAGLGYVMVSSSGSKLKRTMFDASVWQSNRLDFAAGAACIAPLEQRREQPVLVPGDVEVLDTRVLIPPPGEEIRNRAQLAIKEAMAEAEAEARAVRDAYVEAMVDKIAEVSGDEEQDEHSRESARRLVERALEHSTLAGDFPLTLVADDGSRFEVTVGKVLDDRETYHGMKTLDPLEPDYDGARPVGKLYLMSATPGINSFAHGGRFFKLTRPPAMVELVRGKTVEAVERVLTIAKQSPEVFDFGGPLVLVDKGEVHPLDKHGLSHWLGNATQFWHWHQLKNGQSVMVLDDPPSRIADMLLGIGKRRRLKQLEAVITAPTIRPDGSLLMRPGFDSLTGLLLDAKEDDLYPVPLDPTREQVEAALERLMRPFAGFPFVDMLDRSVMLAALLTAAVRPVLPTAPAIGFDAPVQGSGKTLLAKCTAATASGKRAKVQPHCKEEEEIRKRLMTVLLESPRAVVWDNIIGVFDSASLAGLLTSSTYSDRILGVSKSAEVPNRALWLLTGNNLTLAGDMPRRVLKCRIDPETERPFARRFDLEPESYCLKNRQRMVSDALTIIRGWFTAGRPEVPGQMASFELWDTLVRQPVAWIANEVASFAEYDDVMAAVDIAQAQDPEQEMWGDLLRSWRSVFGSEAATCKQVLEACNGIYEKSESKRHLSDALDEYRGHRPLTARSLGKVLQFRADRLVDGLRLRKVPTGGKHAQYWRVEVVE